MEGYKERQSSISVPKNSGVDGFLRTLRTILELPRVQNISIGSDGVVRYMRYVREGEPDGPAQIDYSDLAPWNIIRNSNSLQEIEHELDTPAPTVIANLFNILGQEGLVPIAFATGAASTFWRWHERTAGIRLTQRASAYGLPIYADSQMPDYSLVLCAAFVRTGLVDCHRFLMVGMQSEEFAPPDTNVSIFQ